MERGQTAPVSDAAWGDYLADGSQLAAWAHDTVIAPDQDRDLGDLAEWAAAVTDRRAS